MRMSKFDENRKKREKEEELERKRKEQLAVYYFGISLAAFSLGVLGVAVGLFQGMEFSWPLMGLLAGALILVVSFGILGNNTLK